MTDGKEDRTEEKDRNLPSDWILIDEERQIYRDKFGDYFCLPKTPVNFVHYSLIESTSKETDGSDRSVSGEDEQGPKVQG